MPICHEWNTIAHLNDYEGSPEARPFTREELQRFLDYADDQVDRAVRRSARVRWLLTGTPRCSRSSTRGVCGAPRPSRLDMADWGRNPAAPEFGRYGMLHVRYGKAVRGQPPRRRNVPSVMGWAVEAVADYAENIRPRFGCADHPALWVTERGGRVKPAEINARFVAYRDALGLPQALSPHSLRHAYVTHLTEDGADRRFIQEQVGHRCDTSTAIYTHVSGDFMNTALRKALAPALGRRRAEDGRRPMARKLDYRWHLRQVMASRGMFATTDLIEPLAQRGIRLSSSQVYRLVDRAARAAEPEDPDGAAGHPGLLDG